MKILIDNGHGRETPGKCSPDKRLLEYRYTREIAREVVGALRQKGFDASLLVPEESDIPLARRCRRANAECARLGAENVILVSLHCNAAPPDDGLWHPARGWEAWTSPGQTRADLLARHLYEKARLYLPADMPIRTDTSDGDDDKEAGFYILRHTKCPAVLTENLFQDNRRDMEYLLSAEGRCAIMQLHVDGIISYINALKS